MHNLTRLACCGAALALMLVVSADLTAGKPGGGPKPVTQFCTLDGDAGGTGTVGITASSSGPLMMIVLGGELAGVFDALGGPQTFAGQGRVLKKEGRLDFHFNSDGGNCRPIAWGEKPGPGLPSEVCRYHLLLLNGVYNRTADDVVFQAPITEAQLFDYHPELGNGLVLIGEGSASLMVLF